MIEILNDIDNQLIVAINNAIRCEFLDHFMKMFSGKWIWVPFYLSLAIMAMIRRTNWLQFFTFLLAAGVVIALSDHTCAAIIRPYVGRLRPSNLDNPISSMVSIVGDYRGGSYGFPSCHAANSFALATFIALTFKKWPIVTTIFIWATINSLSRIYLGVHYPGDLIVGAIVGSAIAALVYYTRQAAIKRYAKASATETPTATPAVIAARQYAIYIPIITAITTAAIIAFLSI